MKRETMERMFGQCLLRNIVIVIQRQLNMHTRTMMSRTLFDQVVHVRLQFLTNIYVNITLNFEQRKENKIHCESDFDRQIRDYDKLVEQYHQYHKRTSISNLSLLILIKVSLI